MVFLICRSCTLLQRQEDIPYQIDFNFEGRQFELPYYPYFLIKKEFDFVNGDSCVFFSMRAIEYLLQSSGYKVIDAKIVDNKLYVAFDKLNNLEKIQSFEKRKRLDNQFTYFLLSVKNK